MSTYDKNKAINDILKVADNSSQRYSLLLFLTNEILGIQREEVEEQVIFGLFVFLRV